MTAPTRVRRRPAKAEPYWWFQGETVRELYNRLSAAGPDSCRFEVHLKGDKMTLEVIDQAESAARHSDARLQPLNDSRRCPPICP